MKKKKGFPTIKTEAEFREKFLQYQKSDFFETKIYYETFYRDITKARSLTINEFHLDGVTYDDLSFTSITFNKCHFTSTNMSRWTFLACDFIACSFEECELVSTQFLDCDFIDSSFFPSALSSVDFIDSRIKNLKFSDCGELYNLTFENDSFYNLEFNNCELRYSKFERFIQSKDTSLIFNFSHLNNCIFSAADLSFSRFHDCEFEHNSFLNSKFKADIFSGSTRAIEDAYCSIDLQSIALSENQPADVLKSIFGIHSTDIKQYTSDMTTPINYHKVFISYSFKDKVFAKRLNEALRLKGVSTFLWENDAPGGKRLKTIMSENIQEYDKLLFIASENSIKSPACQFELTEARDKQNKLWKTIYFPIHIDDFLFKVKKDDVRPREKQDEFWANIEELREINSTDFSAFAKDDFDKNEFEKSIHKLVIDLKKT